MADHAVDNEFDGDIFIYRGGRAPQHITHARIDESVDEIGDDAFRFCENLLTVDTHDGIRKVGMRAFRDCTSLRRINLKSVVDIGYESFYGCESLQYVEFGDRLETIGSNAFRDCYSLKHLKLPSIIAIGTYAFCECTGMADIELSERLERIGRIAFWQCHRLQRIAIPLKRNLFVYDNTDQEYSQFGGCEQLTTDIVGGIHKTVASLHMQSWRTEMNEEINRINQVLPSISSWQMSNVIRRWMESLLDKMDHYKAEHCRYVKEGMTLLELALWKAKLGESEEYAAEGKSKKAKVDAESYRRDKRMTCGADMVIKNVLPFLQLK